jgi:hypothetical protein
MEATIEQKLCPDRKVWFSMWFLGAIVTFGLAFFPMFYRLVDGRNKHFQKEGAIEDQIIAYLRLHGKEIPKTRTVFRIRSPEAWAASIIFVIPVFIILYLLSKDLIIHENNQNAFLESAFPEKMFMPQTIPIKTYVLITIVTLGIGAVYWLYKVVNLYNAHYKAHLQVEKEIARLMETENVEHV